MTQSGLDAFLSYAQATAADAPEGWPGAVWFILRIAEDCAGICLQDVASPLRFLRQMEGSPPLQFDLSGFSPDIVDDKNPVRHYVAFVFVGFWLPRWTAVLVLYLWELAGFVRYGGVWSQKDLVSGHLGVTHGGWLRRTAPVVFPSLAASALAARS